MPEPYILCCAACVCCDCSAAKEAREKLAESMIEDLKTISQESAEKVSNWIFDNFDLVPKGVGVAIAKAYRPMFELDSKLKSEKQSADNKESDEGFSYPAGRGRGDLE